MSIYEATVKYQANREPRSGRFGPYHDAVFIVTDNDGEDQEVRVFAEVDQEPWVDDLLELQKQEEVELVPTRNKNGDIKWFMSHWVDDDNIDDPFDGKPKPERRSARREQRPAKPERRSARSERPRRAERAEPDEKPERKTRERKLSTPLFPDEEGTDRLLEILESHCSIIQRIWAGLDREFAADEHLAVRPSEESLKSMTLSVYISARDQSWL